MNGSWQYLGPGPVLCVLQAGFALEDCFLIVLALKIDRGTAKVHVVVSPYEFLFGFCTELIIELCTITLRGLLCGGEAMLQHLPVLLWCAPQNYPHHAPEIPPLAGPCSVR